MPARFDQPDTGPFATAAPRAAEWAINQDLDDWLREKRNRPFESEIIALADLTDHSGWQFAPDTGNLEHRTGRFFTVEGLHVTTNQGRTAEWWQPILVQRDIAILGIIAKYFDGTPHFLLQAKMEPGNAGMVQLSPTVQATSSNYTRVHGGKRTPYVEYFTEPSRGRVLVDVLQSEQGAWFHLKRNRNIVVEVTEEVPAHEDFRWVTADQIRHLLGQRNVINMDARTVLGCLAVFGRENRPHGDEPVLRGPEPGAMHTMPEILSWLTSHKCEHEMSAELVPLNSVPGLRRDATRIGPHGSGNGDFDIVGVRASASTREVDSWKQPLLAPRGLLLAGMVVRYINGTLHVLVRAEAMPGYRDTAELGPTVRFPVDDYAGTPPDRRPDFLDYVLSGGERVHYDVVQSEEGGRFLRAETRYLVVEAEGNFPDHVPPDFMWVTVEQLLALQQRSYCVGVEARTLLLCLTARRTAQE